MKNVYFFDNTASTFSFGKYKDKPLALIIALDPSYVYWCLNNIDEFIVSWKALKEIRLLFPNFIIAENFENHVGNYEDYINIDDYYPEEDDNENNYYDYDWCDEGHRQDDYYERLTWDALTDGQYGDYPGGDIDYSFLGY